MERKQRRDARAEMRRGRWGSDGARVAPLSGPSVPLNDIERGQRRAEGKDERKLSEAGVVDEGGSDANVEAKAGDTDAEEGQQARFESEPKDAKAGGEAQVDTEAKGS